MDEINDFFDLTKDFVHTPRPLGYVSGLLGASIPAVKKPPVKTEEIVADYTLQQIEENEKEMKEFKNDSESDRASSRHGANSSCMDEVDDLSDDDDMDENPKKVFKAENSIYTKYQFDLRHDAMLPIHDNKDQIIVMIRKHPVVILQGDTGCGKTTQVPQYILDDAFKRDEHCNIVCTQPRRIAAISIAQRVSQERNLPLGSVVGYKVGLHELHSEDTRLLYCTTGVLLQKLIKMKTLQSFTHIVLDEVHERDQETDFLLIVIRKFLLTNSKNVKIILMSATINSDEFAKYFCLGNKTAPVMRVDNRKLFKVNTFFFNDLSKINTKRYEIDYTEPRVPDEMYHIALKLIVVIDNIEKQETAVASDLHKPLSILVFLPGINEIDHMWKALIQLDEANVGNRTKVLPIRLHSQIPPDEQRIVFRPAPPKTRKVILATNIAESSITVPDVKYVIDFCLIKLLETDSNTNFTSLKMHWASRSNCRQRAGRAGRVMNGRVYRLVDENFYRTYMQEYGTPEMLRCPLESVVLKVKMMDMGSPPKILALAMNPPNLTKILNTIVVLKELGGLYVYSGGDYVVDDGELTFMGRVMSSLPVSVQLTRLMLLGHVFGCLEDTIIIAAGLSVRSIFKFHCGANVADPHIQKLCWADGSGSDLLAILKAYGIWTTFRHNRYLKDGDSEEKWAERHCINLCSIKEMHLLVLELKDRLAPLGIKSYTSSHRVFWRYNDKQLLLKIVICGAFYPQFFVRSNLNNYQTEKNMYHTLCCYDPCSTVYFTGFNSQHIGPLYTRSIKELFHDVGIPVKNIEVRFQPGTQRVFITFRDDPEEDENDENRLLVPGKVRVEVYKAVRMRMLQMRTAIRVMDPQPALKYALQNGVGELCEGVWQPKKKRVCNPELVVLPTIFQKTMRGSITHIDNCSKFYFQPLSEIERIREISELLNMPDIVRMGEFINASDISKGMLLSAPYRNEYRRARVVKLMCSSRSHLQFKVFFIDYGNMDIVDFVQLRSLNSVARSLIDLPPRVFECRLAMVQPSSVKSAFGKWSAEANEMMQIVANTGILEIEVYSVLTGLANVILKIPAGSFGDQLVEKGHARFSDENFLSKSDHDFRTRKQAVAYRCPQEDQSVLNEEYLRSLQLDEDENVAPPPKELCIKNLSLRGPFSPLETNYFSAIHAGKWKSVQFERESVNAVAIHSDPQDVHEHLVVAASVSETDKNDTLMMRSTTVMPNVHGFAALMTLLFAPKVEIKTNKTPTKRPSKYTYLLAGLGYYKDTMQPLYRDHDVMLNLDVNLSNDDLELINRLRYNMDLILYTPPDEVCPALTEAERATATADIKEALSRLMNKERKYVAVNVENKESEWRNLADDELYPVLDILGERAIFPLHQPPKLYDQDFHEMYSLVKHCRELYRLNEYEQLTDSVTCLLCNQRMDDSAALRMHLLSQIHRDQEQQIRFKKL